MDPNSVTSLTTILAPVLGVHAAAFASIIVAAIFVLSQIMPYLPVASATSSGWYKTLYGVIARVVGARANNAPMPAAGAAPAGGIVPTPPAMKTPA